MIIVDALIWLFIAKVAVLMFEDVVATARGKTSPRLKERARRRAEAGKRPSGPWDRARAAVGDYAAGLVEDAATAARAGRRRRRARKQGRRAIDGVFVDVDDNGFWYADCDVCDWSSRPCRLEDTARGEGADHARSHDPDAEPAAPTVPAVEKPSARPRLKVIPGEGGKPAVSTPQTYSWSCPTCAGRGEGYPTAAAAQMADNQHICTRPADADPDTNPADGTNAAGTNPKEFTVNLEATGPEEIRAALGEAIEAANERAEEVGGVGGVLTEAADRFESLEMAASTVGHIRDAAEQFTAAEAALNSAAEELQAALADFNARDGQVADTVADTGNLASAEVLVG